MSTETDSAARAAYTAYVQEKGYPPTNHQHLLNFAKYHKPPFSGIKYISAKRVITDMKVSEDIEHKTNNAKPVPNKMEASKNIEYKTNDDNNNENDMVHKPISSANGTKIQQLQQSLMKQHLNIKQDKSKIAILNKSPKPCKSGPANAKPIKTIFKILEELEDLDEKYELVPQTTTATLIEINDDIKNAQEDRAQYAESMKIKHKINVLTPDNSKTRAFHDDRLNIDVIPLSPDPILSFKLDIPFNNWNQEIHDEFIKEISKYLEIDQSYLTEICVCKGSMEFVFQLCGYLKEKFPEIKKKVLSAVHDKDLKSIWKLGKTEIKSFFAQKFTKSKENEQVEMVNSNISSNNNNNNEDTLTSAECWLLNQAQKLRDQIHKSLQDCSNEYEISAICALDNPECLQQFIEIDGWKDSTVLYHGTSLNNLGSIFDGFDDKYIGGYTGNQGWYGKGHYFTSFPQYAISYAAGQQRDVSDGGKQITLILAYVNLGQTKTVYQKCEGQAIQYPYSSHYTKVRNCYPISKDEWDNPQGDVFDEYVVNTGKRVLPRFYVTLRKKEKTLIWRDAKLSNAENSGVMDYLSKSHVIYGATCTKDALKIIKKKKDKNLVYVITNGADNSEEFIKNIRNDSNIKNSIFIFSRTRDQWGHVYDKYENIDYTSGLEAWIEQHIMQ